MFPTHSALEDVRNRISSDGAARSLPRAQGASRMWQVLSIRFGYLIQGPVSAPNLSFRLSLLIAKKNFI